MRSDFLNESSGASFGYKKKVVPIDHDVTLTNEDSGKVFMLSATGGTVAVTLPTSLEDGVHYKFIVEEETPSNAITIAAGSAIVSFVMKDAGGNASNSTAGTQISNVIIGATAQKADYVELMAAGGEWVGSALSSIDDAITTS
tara:strand:- start:4553 stop:4981 length:429 start_codon:yes stop_codon:yes gene_type:complete